MQSTINNEVVPDCDVPIQICITCIMENQVAPENTAESSYIMGVLNKI